tara:strand:- start:331 stop:564 length:234 start_codon:yes stop_codon:yes gene_type:complete
MGMEINNVIHAAANIDVTGNTYTQVYSSAALSPVINGVTVSMAAGSTITLQVKTISATAGVFVIGSQKLFAPSQING